jgi:hypothetical protein
MPTVFMGDDDRVARNVEVVEPEVLESLDDVGRQGFPGQRGPRGQMQPLGCTLGPGCGCIGLPLLALAGVVVSSVIALLWVLSLGRLPVSLMHLARQARRGFPRRS